MTHQKRSTLEKVRQREIEAAIGAEPDFLLLRNSVGQAKHVDERTGNVFHVPYGLGVGSPDLVGALLVPQVGADLAIWVALEVKADEGEVDPEQIKCHALWRSFGILVYVVRTADDARNALDDARAIARGFKR